MKNSFKMSYLTWKNAVDGAGTSNYLVRVLFIPLLNILLLSSIFTTAKGVELTLSQLAYQYIYFIPLFSLSAAVSTWESELFSNLGEEYLLRSSHLFSSRCFQVLSECFVSLIFFTICLCIVKAELYHFITLYLLFLTFTYCGIILGFGLGFRHEKAINNFLYSLTWILGFGPGPFFGNKVESYQLIFPGSFAIQGNFYFEWIKLAVYMILFTVLCMFFRRPRKQPLFNR